jgi:hypothetical protein
MAQCLINQAQEQLCLYLLYCYLQLLNNEKILFVGASPLLTNWQHTLAPSNVLRE